MGKVNFFGLLGVLFFNLIIVSGIAIAVAGLLFSFWTVIISFVLSPILLAVVNLLKLQDFNLMQTILSVVLLIVGIALVPLAIKTTRLVTEWCLKYMELNKRAIYAR
ncbi:MULTISPECIES: HAAS domain-containing protein [unclassified Sporosarcina]|uniref:HAAS domain-containing protein n=1 Tax=unclassified Sporosarcina TaxID=2647733 RepID=UPI00203C2594|nr:MULTISPECIES: DUF1700 domain-containing protein [unclassified Sporosarcina]GKV66501.1 hypothetical protein NCCP2331_26540 [Sporosarcina sp. NCCP-2331]GLB56778.1 hypothetical protein NCCP2378_25650 [Sporosarcina sp. NCCP-2378]